MIADIKLLSLKFKNFNFSNNWPRFLLIVAALILIIMLKVLALPLVILLYVVFSLALNISE
jgi:CDP-diacylglycerol--serine O-phosphatidyltransferase